MNKATKRGSVLWVIVSIISLLCAAGLLFIMLQEREKRIETEQELTAVEKAKKNLEQKAGALERETAQLNDQARRLSDEMQQERQKAIADLEQKQAELQSLEVALSNEKRQTTTLANNLAQLKESYENLEKEYKQAQAAAQDLQEQVAKLTGKEGVELKKIIVKNRPKQELKGKVLVVNSEFHFVVIDLGQKEGVSIGDELAVYQAGREVGKVKVERVYEAMSTAAILPGSEEQEIIEDSVVQAL